MAHTTLEYRDGAVTLKGHLADDVRPGPRPGVVLFPEAFGIGDHGNPALAYDAPADRRSWAAMLSLFEEAFGSR